MSITKNMINIFTLFPLFQKATAYTFIKFLSLITMRRVGKLLAIFSILALVLGDNVPSRTSQSRQERALQENSSDPCFGCYFCYANEFCLICSDDWAFVNDEGRCQCEIDGDSFDTEGFCVECRVNGCKTCLHNGYISPAECYQCWDPNAQLDDSGRCVCQDGQILIDGMCEDCPVSLTQGKCEPCPILGCLLCDDGETCDKCTHQTHWTHITEEGQCQCRRNSEGFDSEGWCVECRINGCKTCLHDGLHRPKACSECMDNSADIVDGKCVCPEHQIMLDGICSECPEELVDGKCIGCSILGCAICEDGQTCDKCTEMLNWATIQNGQCQCVRQVETFNADGLCSYCDIKGCAICENDHHLSQTCFECIDERATLSDNNICQCQGGQINDEGYCILCGERCPLGCSCCEYDDPTICIECLPDGFMFEDGICQCQYIDETFDTESSCVECRINGCRTCLHDGKFVPEVCFECLDADAVIVDGKCVCPEHQIMLDGICSDCPTQLIDGKCIACSILGCAVCEDGQSCHECTHPSEWVEISDGQCGCVREGESFNTDGVCSKCQVDGCAVCLSDTFQSSTCAQCLDPRAQLTDDGSCVCEGADITDHGYCQFCAEQCNVVGCSCCDHDDPDRCLQCIDAEWTIIDEDGQCYCTYSEDERPDSEGICDYCYVPNCASCHVDNSELCGRCEETALLNQVGRCECKSSFVRNGEGGCFEVWQQEGVFVAEDGVQVECSVGCKECSQRDQCSRCLSNFFKEEGQCIQCDCSCLTCKGSTEQDCLSCPTGFFLSEHSCLSCLTTNCLSCSAPQLCTACAETFVLDDGHCASCPHNCVQCHSPSICTECEAGFSVQSDGSCMECLSSCSSCSSADVRVCQSCSSGHYLANGQCLSCTGNCLECDSPSRCTVCRQGFVERDGECAQQCSRPCLECSFSDGQQHCSKCLGGYTVEGHECQPDLSCNQDSSCEACPFGTALAEGTCQTCRTPGSSCRKCSAEDLSRCLSCSPGFFLEKGSCQACGAGCDECQSANFCVACSEGFFELLADGSRTGKCSPCQSPCLACGKSASECLSCVDGFSKEGWKCISDIRVIFGLLFDADIRAFIREIPDFRAFLTSLLSLSIPDDSITLTLLESGSVRVQGSLQARSSAEGQTIFNDLSSKLKEGKSVLGYEIMESEIEKQNIKNQPHPGPESISVGAIIGITIGVLILLAVFIVFIRYKRNNSVINQPSSVEQNTTNNHEQKSQNNLDKVD